MESKTKEVIENNLKKNSLVEKINDYSGSITFIATILAALYSVINYVYDFVFSISCEEFYKIPSSYFSANINRRLLYLGLIMLLILMFFFPALLRSHEKKHGKDTKTSLAYSVFLSVVLGIEMGFTNLYNLIEIMKATNNKNEFFAICNKWIDKNAYFVIVVIILFGSMSLVGLVFISEIKSKKIKKIFTVIFLISFTISALLMIYGALLKLTSSIKDKTKYEIITNQENKYVVISKIEDNVLVVKYNIENNKIEFDTTEYLFLDKYNCNYSYIDFNMTPIIVNKNVK
jgi:hypothetical protein